MSKKPTSNVLLFTQIFTPCLYRNFPEYRYHCVLQKNPQLFKTILFRCAASHPLNDTIQFRSRLLRRIRPIKRSDKVFFMNAGVARSELYSQREPFFRVYPSRQSPQRICTICFFLSAPHLPALPNAYVNLSDSTHDTENIKALGERMQEKLNAALNGTDEKNGYRLQHFTKNIRYYFCFPWCRQLRNSEKKKHLPSQSVPCPVLRRVRIDKRQNRTVLFFIGRHSSRTGALRCHACHTTPFLLHGKTVIPVSRPIFLPLLPF